MEIADVLEVRNAVVDATGEVQVVAGVEGKRICVIGYVLALSAAGYAKWISRGTADTALTGPMQVGASSVISAAPCRDGYFSTNPGESLVCVGGGGAHAGGHVSYVIK